MSLIKSVLAYLAIVPLLIGPSNAQQASVQEVIETLAGMESRVVGYLGYDEAAAGDFWLIVDYMSDGSLNEITIM